jgi:predicted kinase
LNNRAQAYLQRGFSVIVDGTFSRRADRQRVAQEAMHQGATVIFLECVAPREMALQRLAQRWQTRVNSPTTPPSSASDGRPELYDAQVARWEAFDPAQEPGIRHLMLSTTQSPQATMASLLHTLAPALAQARPQLECRSPGSDSGC